MRDEKNMKDEKDEGRQFSAAKLLPESPQKYCTEV